MSASCQDRGHIVTCRDGEDHWPDVNCHENGESAHEKSTTYEQIAIFILRGVLEAHDACCKIAFTLICLP
jgi:hypothetical protein